MPSPTTFPLLLNPRPTLKPNNPQTQCFSSTLIPPPTSPLVLPSLHLPPSLYLPPSLLLNTEPRLLPLQTTSSSLLVSSHHHPLDLHPPQPVLSIHQPYNPNLMPHRYKVALLIPSPPLGQVRQLNPLDCFTRIRLVPAFLLIRLETLRIPLPTPILTARHRPNLQMWPFLLQPRTLSLPLIKPTSSLPSPSLEPTMPSLLSTSSHPVRNRTDLSWTQRAQRRFWRGRFKRRISCQWRLSGSIISASSSLGRRQTRPTTSSS
jgi:hypothetical protein